MSRRVDKRRRRPSSRMRALQCRSALAMQGGGRLRRRQKSASRVGQHLGGPARARRAATGGCRVHVASRRSPWAPLRDVNPGALRSARRPIRWRSNVLLGPRGPVWRSFVTRASSCRLDSGSRAVRCNRQPERMTSSGARRSAQRPYHPAPRRSIHGASAHTRAAADCGLPSMSVVVHADGDIEVDEDSGVVGRPDVAAWLVTDELDCFDVSMA